MLAKLLKTYKKYFFKRKGTLLDFLLGVLLGILAFWLIYGFSTLNVQYDSWIFAGYIEQDIIQSYGGWLYFRHAPWTWPLTVAENISVPIGMSIAFTDSIPLVSVVLKCFSSILPATFQFFGWYNLFNFMLVGGFSVLLIRGFKFGRIYSLLASVLFVCAPIFLERIFRHNALASQWLVIAALWLYFKSRREKERFPVFGFTLLCTLAVGIHTYFLPMVYAIFFAALVYQVLKKKKFLWYVLYLGISFVPVILLAYALGILTRGGGGSAFGFGYYSMNVNALANPISFDWYDASERMSWSRFVPALPQNQSQYDGFSYAGLGILFALVVMIIYAVVRIIIDVKTKRKDKLRWGFTYVKSHIGLLFVCVCLTVFAFSNIVVLNQTTLFTVPLPEFVLVFCGIFRASGRLFWVCCYLLTTAVVVFVGRVIKPKWRIGALLFVVVVQLADISGTLVKKHEYFSNGPVVVENEFSSDGWKFLAQNYDTVYYLRNMFDYNLTVSFIRYNPNVKTNALLANRGAFETVQAEYETLLAQLVVGEPIENGVLYVCDTQELYDVVMQYAHPSVRGYQIGQYYFLGNHVEGNPLEELYPMQYLALANNK